MRIKHPWLSLGMMTAAGFLKKSAAHFAQMQVAIAYLKGVDVVRDVMLFQIGIIVSVVFLAIGFAAMQCAVLFFFPMETAMRAALGFAMGLFDFGAALWVLLQLVSSKRWLEQAAKYNVYLRDFLSEERKKDLFSNHKRGIF